MTNLDHLLQLKSLLLFVSSTCVLQQHVPERLSRVTAVDQSQLESSQWEQRQMKKCELLSSADPTCIHKLDCAHNVRSEVD